MYTIIYKMYIQTTVHVHVVFILLLHRLNTVKRQREIMQEELKKTTMKTLSAEEKAHKIDQVLAEEEAKVAAVEKEIAIAQEKQFKKAQELKQASIAKQNKEAEIQVKTEIKTQYKGIHMYISIYRAVVWQYVIFIQSSTRWMKKHSSNKNYCTCRTFSYSNWNTNIIEWMEKGPMKN